MGDDPPVDTRWVALLSAGRERQTRRRGGREKTEKTLAGACGSKCRRGSKSTEAEQRQGGQDTPACLNCRTMSVWVTATLEFRDTFMPLINKNDGLQFLDCVVFNKKKKYVAY